MPRPPSAPLSAPTSAAASVPSAAVLVSAAAAAATTSSGAIPKQRPPASQTTRTTNTNTTTSAGAPAAPHVPPPSAALDALPDMGRIIQPGNTQDYISELAQLEAHERVLQARIRVAQLEAEAAAAARPRSVMGYEPTRRRVRAVDIEGLLMNFSGDDNLPIDRWLTEFNSVMDSLQADDDDRYRMCRQLLKGSAFTFLYTAQATNWVTLRSALLARFHRQVSYFEVYDQLRTRHRRPTETTIQYVTEMQFIAAKAKVPDSDLIPLIIAGMRSHSAYVSTFAGIHTMSDLIAIIPNYDRLVSADRAMGPRVAPSAPSQRRTSSGPSTGQPSKPSSTSKQEITCYNCNDKGHYSLFVLYVWVHEAQEPRLSHTPEDDWRRLRSVSRCQRQSRAETR